MKNLVLRDAAEIDAPIISELIYVTEDHPEHVWGHGTKEEILERLESLIRGENFRYSLKNIKVAELSGKVCGVIVGLKEDEIMNLDIKTTIKLLSLIKGLKNKVKFIYDVIQGYSLTEAEKGEFYISNIATSPEVRGLGIGKELIKIAENMAKEKGYKNCSLLAKDKVVKSFYEKLDYKFEEIREYCSQDLYRMVKVV